MLLTRDQHPYATHLLVCSSCLQLCCPDYNMLQLLELDYLRAGIAPYIIDFPTFKHAETVIRENAGA